MNSRFCNILCGVLLLAGIILNATPAEDMLSAAAKTEEGLVAMADNAKNTPAADAKKKPILAPVAYEAMILAYADVEVNPKEQYSFKSNYVTKAMNAISKKYQMPSMDEFLPRLLEHENAKVRAKALSLMPTFLTGISNKNSALCQKIMDTEKDPIVLGVLIQKLRNEGNKNPGIARFLVSQLDSADAEIRYMATIHCASTWNNKVQALVDKYVDMILNEKDAKVRSAVCRYAARVGNEAVLAPYEKILADKDQAKFHKDALEGIVILWWNFPLFAFNSQKAYELTVKYLKELPRSKELPAMPILQALSMKAQDKTMEKWREKSPWFKPEEIQPLLVPYVTDNTLRLTERTKAIKALWNMGYTAEQLAALVAECEATGTEKPSDLKQLDKTLKDLK